MLLLEENNSSYQQGNWEQIKNEKKVDLSGCILVIHFP